MKTDPGMMRLSPVEKICFLVIEFSQEEFTKEQAFKLFRDNDLKYHRELIKQLTDKNAVEFVRYGNAANGKQNNVYRMTGKAQEISNDYLERMERLTNYIAS